MFRKLRTIAKALGALGGTANYGRIKGLRDLTLAELLELKQQRQILEDTMRPKYTEAQYRNSLARIEADERRLEAKFDRYDAQMRETVAGVERRALELESTAASDEPGQAPPGHAGLLGFRDSDEFLDAATIAGMAGINPTQTRPYYQSACEMYGQNAVMELAKLIRDGHFEDRFPDHNIETALTQLAEKGYELDGTEPEGEPTVEVRTRDQIMEYFGISAEGFAIKYQSYTLALQISGKTSGWNHDVDDLARETGALTEGEVALAQHDLDQAVLNRVTLALTMEQGV